MLGKRQLGSSILAKTPTVLATAALVAAEGGFVLSTRLPILDHER